MTSARIVGAAGLLACVAILPACQSGHGQHTSQALVEAQDRLAALKAGSEYEMASQQYFAGDLEKAERTVEKSIAYNGSVAKSHVLRGRILIEQGRLDDAKDAFARALAVNPADPDALYYSGLVFERFSDYPRAYERYRAAAEADTSNPQFPIAAAEMLAEQGLLDEAQALLESRRAEFEHHAGLRQSLGHIAMLKGEHDRAVSFFEEARTLAPDDRSSQEDLARAQVSARRYVEASRTIDRLLETGNGHPSRDLRGLRARCLMGMGRFTEARSEYLALTSGREGSRDAAAWIGLGEAACRLGDFTRARIAGNRAVAIAPDRPEGHLLLAACMRDTGDALGALSAIDRAIELAPGFAPSWALRGLTLSQLGRSDEAAQSLATALRIDPTDAAVRGLLASVEAHE